MSHLSRPQRSICRTLRWEKRQSAKEFILKRRLKWLNLQLRVQTEQAGKKLQLQANKILDIGKRSQDGVAFNAKVLKDNQTMMDKLTKAHNEECDRLTKLALSLEEERDLIVGHANGHSAGLNALKKEKFVPY